jgi:hypothetical protein
MLYPLSNTITPKRKQQSQCNIRQEPKSEPAPEKTDLGILPEERFGHPAGRRKWTCVHPYYLGTTAIDPADSEEGPPPFPNVKPTLLPNSGEKLAR